MIDRKKRKTLKRMGMIASTVTVAGVHGVALASEGAAVDSIDLQADSKSPDFSSDELPLADIQVYTRVSSRTNDVEVVIQNAGDQVARITQITPSQTSTRRGHFDFYRLLDNGELHLAAGEQVSVPMTPHPVVLDSSTTAQQRAASLTQALRASFSVVTEGDAFAKITVAEGIRFA